MVLLIQSVDPMIMKSRQVDFFQPCFCICYNYERVESIFIDQCVNLALRRMDDRVSKYLNFINLRFSNP